MLTTTGHCLQKLLWTQIYINFPPFGDTQIIKCVAQGKVTPKQNVKEKMQTTWLQLGIWPLWQTKIRKKNIQNTRWHVAAEGFMKNQNLWRKIRNKKIGYRPKQKKGQNTPTVFFFFLYGGRWYTWWITYFYLEPNSNMMYKPIRRFSMYSTLAMR